MGAPTSVPHVGGYLDAAAGLPLSSAAREGLLAALDDGWADPAKLYRAGRRARQLLEGAREAVAEVVGARPDEVSFVSSGTAAAHLGVLGTLAGRERTGRHVVHSAVEHSCVLLAAAHGTPERTSVAVDAVGRVELDAWSSALRPDTALACLISASHEVGTVQPVERAAELCGPVPLLVDAAQSVGRTGLPGGWSLLTASAAKWGGPTGVGVLAVRTGVRWRAPWPTDARGPSGSPEPGSLSLPAVLSAALALQSAAAAADGERTRLWPLVDRLRTEVPRRVPDLYAVGDPARRLPHVACFSSPYLDGEALQRGLDRAGFAVSSGSSCSASALEPSHVLAAMGVLSAGSIRVSLHAGVGADDVERFLDVLPQVAAEQRAD